VILSNLPSDEKIQNLKQFSDVYLKKFFWCF
jgi:hypothetical protein